MEASVPNNKEKETDSEGQTHEEELRRRELTQTPNQARRNAEWRH